MKRDWKYKTSIEKRLAQSLTSLSAKIEVIASNSTNFQEMRASIAKLSRSVEWREFAWTESVRMVQGVAKQNATTWRQAAQNAGRRGVDINRILRSELFNNGRFLQLVREHSKVIQSIPADVAEEITEKASKRFVEGYRSDVLLKDIKAMAPGLSITKAQLIARTETAKAQSAVTQIRSEELGIDWYVWRSSEDQRVRSSHKGMDGVLCKYSDPPPPEALFPQKNKDGTIQRNTLGRYGPGECPNCRCYAEPVIDIEFLKFPMKVYHSGKIQRMGKKQFLAL